MIRQGLLCRGCSDTQCRTPGSDQEPIEIDCPACDGDGCNQCDDGVARITTCPNKYCSDVAGVVTMSDFIEKGLLPVVGGVLDQSAWLLHAVRILDRDEARIRAERSNAN